MTGCTCTSCPMCGGKGTFWEDGTGRRVSFGDDLCDLVACDECNGSGIDTECDYCHDRREQDEDAR